MRKRLIYWSLGTTLLLCGGAMAAVLYFAAHKNIAVAQVASNGAESEEESQQNTGKVSELHFQIKEEDAECLYIPLQEGVAAEAVSVENRYLQRELWIHIQGGQEAFYRKEALYGNDDAILAGECRTEENGVVIRLKLQKAYECISTVGNGRLSVRFCDSREVYDKIAVVDFLPQDTYGETVFEGIADAMWQIIPEENVKIYYMRGTYPLSDEEKLSLLREWQPDFYLQISVGESGDAADFGVEMYYPSEYFIPGFGNIAFADMVEKNVAEALQNRANGLFACGEEELILQTVGTVCARLQIGYESNPAEKKRLSAKEWQETIAGAVYASFLEAWEQCG